MRRQQQSSTAHSASRAADGPRLAARACAAAAIRAYQRVLRPVMPPACRFAPTCSEYAHDAVLSHGFLRGGALALRRIGRCHPWHPGGYDPVPGAGG